MRVGGAERLYPRLLAKSKLVKSVVRSTTAPPVPPESLLAAKTRYGLPGAAGGMTVVCSSGKSARYGGVAGLLEYVRVWSGPTEKDLIVRGCGGCAALLVES